MLNITLHEKPTVREIPQFKGGFYVSDSEKRMRYGIEKVNPVVEEILRFARMLRRGEMVEGTLPAIMAREEEFYLRTKLGTVEDNNCVLFTVLINGTDIRIVRRR